MRAPDPVCEVRFVHDTAVVTAPDDLHDRAVAAGATVLRPVEDTDYGSRQFVVRDPEGNVWSFGTW
ncbi:hypothetical protein GCM10010210_48400 [Pseudonocardia hydrocarbonoxydans]|uniref:Glyoxalase-like domain-containing protein n=1 Tax=Pseudonocardia hydrocarbonoxydans TaxID=76726 RepID=A0A4Y3WKX8_9PSEU|nr:VOC family protein [Pseudonocardia hydrocarbonoxydans]GEC19607.1 hypothetical protein PHY01_18900 [Pseudonocardia hydrocarbonoxydans]